MEPTPEEKPNKQAADNASLQKWEALLNNVQNASTAETAEQAMDALMNELFKK
jgi:hypothetical protein